MLAMDTGYPITGGSGRYLGGSQKRSSAGAEEHSRCRTDIFSVALTLF